MSTPKVDSDAIKARVRSWGYDHVLTWSDEA